MHALARPVRWPLFLALALLMGSATARAQGPLPLTEALSEGLVTSEIVGRSSTYFQPLTSLALRNVSGGDLQIAVPSGIILRDKADGRCDLIALRSEPPQILLPVPPAPDAPPVIARIFSYCLDVVSPGGTSYPSPNSRYVPTGEIAEDPIQEVLANVASSGQQESFGAQLAIWVAATGRDLTALEAETGADYGLYHAQVTEFLGSVVPPRTTASPDASPTAATMAAGTVLGSATAVPSGSTPTDSETSSLPLLLGGVLVVLLALTGTILLSRHSQRAPRSIQAPSGGATVPPPITPPTSRTPSCIRCKQPLNTLGECTNPGCPESLDFHTNLGPNPGDTRPLPKQQFLSPNSDGRISAHVGPNPSDSPPGGQAPRPWENRGGAPPAAANTPSTTPTLRPTATVASTEPLEQQVAPGSKPVQPTDVRSVQDAQPVSDDLRLELRVLRGSQGAPTTHVLNRQAGGLQGILSRAPIPQVSLPDTSVSMPHAVLDVNHGGRGPHIRDLGSRNGTLVNGTRISQSQWRPVPDGAQIQLGKLRLRFDQRGQRLIEEATGGRTIMLPQHSNRCLLTRAEIPFIDFGSDDTRISVPHVYIRLYQGLLEVWDLSSNGVNVQGQRIQGREPIFDGDKIEFGTDTVIQVSTNVEGIPEIIDGWKLDGMIGRGGMAYVYRVRQGRGKDSVRALKVPQPTRFREVGGWGETYRRLFRQEAALGSKLHSPHLVDIYGQGNLGGALDIQLPYLLMEYVDGPSLHALVEKQGNEQRTTFELADAAEIAYQVAEALRVIQGAGYVHCDVKPTNILVCHTGQVYLTDLGVATPIGREFSELGVERYLPREVLENKIVAPTTDVFSLGMVLLDMLASSAATPPTAKGDSKLGVASTSPDPGTVKGPVARVGEIADPTMQAIIRQCLSAPRERFQQMDELLATLEPLRVGARLPDLVARSGWKPLQE